MSKLIDMQARRLGNRVAIMYRDSCVEFWHEVAWNMLAQTVNRTANALLTLGIRPQQKIMIYAENMPECLYASFGAYMVKAVTIPVFATLNVTRLKYIIDEAEVSYVFVGEQKQYDTAFALYALCPSLVKLIMCDRQDVSILFRISGTGRREKQQQGNRNTPEKRKLRRYSRHNIHQRNNRRKQGCDNNLRHVPRSP